MPRAWRSHLLPVRGRDGEQELRRFLKNPSFPPREQWGVVRHRGGAEAVMRVTERGGRLKSLGISPWRTRDCS